MSAPSAPARLAAYCRAITRQPALAEIKLCLLAAVFVALEGPHLRGFPSQGAYAREALGMSAPSFSRRRRVGLFLLHCPAARVGLLSGQFSFGALELLLRRCGAPAALGLLDLLPGKSLKTLEVELEAIYKDGIEVPEPSPAPTAHAETPLILMDFHVPEPLARLLQQNQDLADRLCGGLDQATANAMWIAEAASETHSTHQAQSSPECRDPWRALGLRAPSSSTRIPQDPLPRVDLPIPSAIKGHRKKIARLDAKLVAIAREQRILRSRMRDQFFALYQEFAWHQLGYHSAEAFAEVELGLSARAWWQAIADARRRRRDDPIALALAQGEIGDWAARRLDEFRRSAHVGNSGLQPWVKAARDLSCVALRERIALAQQWARFQTREYSLRGWPVPTAEDLLTPECSLERLLEGPELPNEPHLLAARRVRIQLELSPDVRDELLSLWSALHTKRLILQPDTSPWTSLLLLLARARLGMLQIALANDEPARAQIHWRDGWRCANPTCGSYKRLHSHHIDPLGRGGPDTPENQITLCECCHLQLLHQGLLRINGQAGDPERPLRFEMSFDNDGRPQRAFLGDRRIGWAA